MYLSQDSQTPDVDYYPAQLHKGKRWYIGFYVTNPKTGDLERKCIKWNRIKNTRDRYREGQRRVKQINDKLANGWNPFLENEAPKAFTSFTEVAVKYIELIERKVSKNELRKDTLRSYKSWLKMFTDWLSANGKEDIYCYFITDSVIIEFLEYIYYERDNSARTHNNYLDFLINFFDWMVGKKFLTVNPAKGIKRERLGPKKRQLIPHQLLRRIFDYFNETNPNYKLLCDIAYSCMVRRTELCRTKVKDVYISNQIIAIPGDSSKNGKNQPVNIPQYLLKRLQKHIENSHADDYLFSKNGLRTGKKQVSPKYISDTWARMRKKLKVDTKYQWYSIKDTGITDLLRMGVPVIKVRDQARHKDISTTNTYTPTEILTAQAEFKDIKTPIWASN